MDVRNCNSCGKIYNYYGGQPFCPTCTAKLDEKFKDVKEYIYENPLAGVQEVADEFEISPQIIYRWVREERLAFAEDSAIGIACEGCGVTIKSGRYCKKCKAELVQGLSHAFHGREGAKNDKNQLKTGAKMRFFNE